MEFQRRLKPAVNLDLVPMIDVVFQLVLFFLVTSTFIVTPGINLNLPEAESSEPVLVSKLVITVLSEEEIYVNRERYTLRGLGPALRGLSADLKDKVASLVVEGDSDIPYRLMVQVLDVLRKEGYRGMALKTRDKKTE
jgi:biopolymer transport protein ExbD